MTFFLSREYITKKQLIPYVKPVRRTDENANGGIKLALTPFPNFPVTHNAKNNPIVATEDVKIIAVYASPWKSTTSKYKGNRIIKAVEEKHSKRPTQMN
jgi:hypothetical protein